MPNKWFLKSYFLVLYFITTINPVFAQDSVQQTSPNNDEYMPFTIRTSQRYQGQRRCGFRDKSLYINNGTYQEIGFYSREKFSLFVQTDSPNISITGFALAVQISTESLSHLMQQQQKIYNIQRYKQILVNEGIDSDSHIQIFQQEKSQQQLAKRYYANLTVYGICRTASVSTIAKNLQIKITYLQDTNFPSSSLTNKQTPSTPQEQNQIAFSLYTQTVTIPTTVYCIDGVSIKQANFFVCKIYYVMIVSIFGLLLNFKPLKRVPLFVRMFALIGYVWVGLLTQTLYEAFFSTYGAMFLLVVFYRIFEQRVVLQSQASRRETVISKSYILASFASALPLAIKSHLDDQSIEQKKITLYLINIIMLCNTILFIASIVNLTRFRHAFYYFLAIVFSQHYLYNYVKPILAFNILQFQIFPVPYECESIFFAICIIPLCNFFFKSYSSESLYKFVILLVPILARPFFISYSVSFAVGIFLWILNGRHDGHDLIKIIKQKQRR